MSVSSTARLKARTLLSTSALAILTGAMAAPSAAAQAQSAQSPAAIDEIVVTGSRIVRDGYEAPTPVSVLGMDELNAMAANNIADAVNTLPVFYNSTTPRTQTGNLSAGVSGSNFLNLRGLGPNRTLVLLDGQRVVNASINTTTSAPDVNAFPNGLVERVDVVTGGASAAYGSDALAGVVNFVLDRDFTGIKGEAQAGMTTYKDNKGYSFNLSAGTPFASGRGHIIAFGEIAHDDGKRGNFRKWNEQGAAVIENPNYTATNGQPFYLMAEGVGLNNGTPGGLITAGPLKGTMFGPGGSVSRFTYGLVSTNNMMQGGDFQLSRIDNGQDLMPEIDRYVTYVRGSYDITDSIEAFALAQWSHADSWNDSNSNRRLGNNTIRRDNAFIPASIQTEMDRLGLTQFTLGSTHADIPRFRAINSRSMRRYAFGVEGALEAFASEWNWEINYQKSQAGLSIRTASNGITANYLRAIDAVLFNGAPVCRVNADANPANDDPLCVPFNVMGIGVNDKKALNYVTGTGYRYDSLRQQVWAGSMTGEPFELWAGPVSLAMGAEHRTESVRGLASAIDEATGYFAGNYKASNGKYSVTEGFIETLVPLAKDEDWARSLELNGAIRATDYSTSGYVTTWKIGGTWSPVDDLRVRATRSRDIRAPNLGELFAAGTTGSGITLLDPFTGERLSNTFSLSRGNPILLPEKADTTGLGVVFSPTFWDGFNASVDYYNIDISGAVRVPSSQNVVNGCFAGNTVLCPNIQRSAPLPGQTVGSIFLVVTSPQNLLRQQARGLDFEASYRFPLSMIDESMDGNFSIRFIANHVLSIKTFDEGRVIEGAGVLADFAIPAFDVGLSAPDWRGSLSLAYDGDPISVRFTARHIAGGVYNNAFIECRAQCPTSTANSPTIDNNQIASNTLLDLSMDYKPFAEQDIEVFLAIENLTNAPPPVIGGSLSGATFNGMNNNDYDRLGRSYRLGVRFQF